MLYMDRLLFEATLGSSFTDTYDVSNYGVDAYNDAAMNAVLGQTRYTTTTFVGNNLVKGVGDQRHYCAGCNGSFLLDFTMTALLGPGDGVFGVGFDVFGNETVSNYTAFVTFGDNSVANYEIPNANPGEFPFWGITDSLLIRSIHFGLPGGGAYPGDSTSVNNPSMALDNLTIGSMGDMSVIPLPAAFWLFATALAGLAGLRLRNASRAA